MSLCHLNERIFVSFKWEYLCIKKLYVCHLNGCVLVSENWVCLCHSNESIIVGEMGVCLCQINGCVFVTFKWACLLDRPKTKSDVRKYTLDKNTENKSKCVRLHM